MLATGAAAATADDYAYAWPIQTQGNSSAWQVELTPEVYAAVATADLRDVVVVNAAGEAVPSAAYRPPAAAVREELVDLPAFTLPATPTASAAPEAIRLQIERGTDGKLRRVDADLGAAAPASADARHDLLLDASAIKKPLAALRVEWAQRQPDTTAQFEVDGSEDLQQWRTLVPRATVLRLMQNGNLLDRHDIALNNARAIYLRVHRLDDGPELLELVVRARTMPESSAAHAGRQWLTAASDGLDTRRVRPTFPDAQRPTAFRYHLPAPLAVETLRIELADDNSLARVHALSRHDPDNPSAWEQRADLVAFRLRQGDNVIDNDAVAVSPAMRALDWSIESATPLEHAPTLSVSFTPDRLVFLAQGAGPYRLAAGSGKARRDDYPIDAALASLRASEGKDWQPPLATLGTRATLVGEPARVAAPEHTFDWKTWLLWAVLVGAAALIGGLALSLLRSGRGEKGDGRG